MSAIWGLLSFSAPLMQNAGTTMEQIFRNHCKIDQYAHITSLHSFWGCGIQHLTEESQSEILPFHDAERGLFFNADCMLDNRQELIQELSLSSEPDGSLMLLSYKKWGINCLKHLRGLFSMAVYEESTKTLYLATDHTASRCLYYYRQGDLFVYSTLITPILSIFQSIPYNELYIKDYLTAPGLMPNIVSDETPYKGIYKLNPGCFLTITADSITETQYWNPSFPLSDCHCKQAEEYGMYFRQLYSSCVADALRCNGQVGIAMSSGLDSATVGALAATALKQNAKKLMTYTYVPSLDTQDRNPNNITNEQADVKSIVELYSNMVPHFLNNHGKNCLENFDESLRIMEFPFKAYVNMPNLREIYNLAASDGCKVLLTGQCGNSTVSHGYIDDVLYDLYSSKRGILFLKYLNHYSKTVHESRRKALLGCLRYFQYTQRRYKAKDFVYTPTNSFLSPEVLNHYPLKERFQKSGNVILENLPIGHHEYLAGLYKASLYTYMGELETKMGLANGIIIRDPTKDMRILSFCYHLPYRLFAYRGIPRWLIRGNLADLLPTKLLDNWMRYGVQNADYLKRIQRDLPKLMPMLNEVRSAFQINGLIDFNRLTAYLDTLPNAISGNQFESFDNLIYILGLQLFFQSR